MNKTLSLLAAASAVAFSFSAVADDKTTYKAETKIEQDEKGNFEKTVSETSKDDSGKMSAETKTEVDVDRDGNVEKTVKSESVNDPKGLFNKTKVKTEDKVKKEDGKMVHEHKKKVNGDTVEHTKQEVK